MTLGEDVGEIHDKPTLSDVMRAQAAHTNFFYLSNRRLIL